MAWHSRLLMGSEAFDRRFYRVQLGRAGHSGWGQWLPLCHYLFRGYRLGLNPSAAFDTDWYLSANPDVANAGLNPLIHYLRAGRFEGRLPRPDAPPAFFDPPPVLPEVDVLCHKLWGGFPHRVESALCREGKQGNARAALELASWAYTHGKLEVSASWLQSGAFRGQSALGPRRLKGLAKTYSLLRQHEKLEGLLKQPGVARAMGTDADYAAANVQSGAAQRLAPVNQRLGARGLVPLTCSGAPELVGLLPAQTPPAMPEGDRPLISVIVPAYNAGAGLALALDSLLNQTWTALEIIVVDDASTDDTQERAERYNRLDARVRYHRNKRNLGAYPTRNQGLALATGAFVTVHDGDDWSHPQKLESQVRPLLDNENLAACVSHWVRVDSDLRYLGCWMMGEGFVELNPSSWLIRRRWLDALGGWDNVNVGADSEFAQRLEFHLGREALHFLWPDTPLAFARVDANTLTRTKATHLRTLFHGLRRLYAEASHWWLRHGDGAHSMTEPRPFPVPLGNFRQGGDRFDAVVAGNFALRGRALDALMRQLDSVLANSSRVCLLHWPDYSAWHGNTIADAVFGWCQAQGVRFAHAGLTLTAPRVILLEPVLWHAPTTETVRLEGLEVVADLEGRPCDDQAALCDYFKRGGVAMEQSE